VTGEEATVSVIRALNVVGTVEDVIITKLRWSLKANRGKDVDDVRNVIAIQDKRIDWGYVENWCDVHGTRPLLENIRASIPPA
jgi:hypothetical protein